MATGSGGAPATPTSGTTTVATAAIAILIQCLGSALAGANPHDLVDPADEDFSVADASGPGAVFPLPGAIPTKASAEGAADRERRASGVELARERPPVL
jgi:hypothetical protein